ncbi:MAG: DUF4198 domain-containing protein [Pyrinomonadaceae bacterium]|nr:DUF4198 domain-containing protein [Pyrinomonadaceae bacterium]
MKTKIIFFAMEVVLTAMSVFAHDLFLKPTSYFVKVNEKITISVMNGTFQASEGSVTFARLTDVSVITPSGRRSNPAETDFTKNETTAFLNLVPTEAGTHVVGLSTSWRENGLPAKEFNEYLPAEGIPDILENRKRDGELDKDARYRYSKYVKTIFQAGNKATDNYNTILGYAAEMVPQQNPYNLKKGSSLDILCLKDGKPLAGQIVTTGYEAGGKMLGETSGRTDKDGLLKVKLTGAGRWYAKFINMVKMDDPKLNYESKWATLTFEIK